MAEEQKQFVLSKTGYEALKQELQALEAERERQMAEVADMHDGTDSTPEEGADFETQTTKEHIEERIGHIQLVLEQAQVLEDDPNPQGVDPGERVTVWDFDAKCERVFNVVSSDETVYARDEIKGNEVSTDSPVGQALLGKGIGDVIEVAVPDGITRYAIRRIERIDG